MLIAPFDPWDSKICSCPRKYSLSPYTGCSHKCLYCYITSYIPDAFNARPKKDFIRRLNREISKIDRRIPIMIANSSDPYIPLERELGLSRSTLKILRKSSIRFLIITKSDLITRDLDILQGTSAAVSITVTTLDNEIWCKLEPSAPAPYRRLKAIEHLVNAGVPCSVRLDPIIPQINSGQDQLRLLIKRLAEYGVKHLTVSTYKAKPDNYGRLVQVFPNLKRTLHRLYWEMGEHVGGARYLPSNMRLELMKQAKRIAATEGMTFASCREGFGQLNSSTTCDSSHLIPEAGG